MKTKVTSKGQITIPYRLREKYHISPGDDLEFIEGADVLTITRKVDEAQMRASIGVLKGKIRESVAEVLVRSRGKVEIP